MNKRGTSIIEVVIYLAVLIVMVVAIVVGIIQMSQVFNKTRNERKVATVGENVLDRMLREVKLGGSIIGIACSGQPCVDINGLPAFDSPLSSLTERRITISGNKLVLTSGGTTEDLTPPDVTITNFSVAQFASLYLDKTSVSQGIRIKFTVSAGSGKYAASHDYVGAAVMRHSYP